MGPKLVALRPEAAWQNPGDGGFLRETQCRGEEAEAFLALQTGEALLQRVAVGVGFSQRLLRNERLDAASRLADFDARWRRERESPALMN